MTSATETQDLIVWVDCEMTGLDLKRDALVEIAVVVSDSELTLVDEGIDVLIAPPQEAIEQMSDVVREMHTSSGLLAELSDGLTLEAASHQVLEYVKARVPDHRRAPLAGNSVGTDRAFLERDIQELTDYLHYRIIDVSSIKELARRWYPRVYFNAPAKSGGHRAMADILESIAELRYYRAALFPAEPGPDTATARRIASGVIAQGQAIGLPAPSPDGADVAPAQAPPDASHQR